MTIDDATINLHINAEPLVHELRMIAAAIDAITTPVEEQPEASQRGSWVSFDASRLTWDGRIPSAAELTAYIESMPAGEFATGLLVIADALREREQA